MDSSLPVSTLGTLGSQQPSGQDCFTLQLATSMGSLQP